MEPRQNRGRVLAHIVNVPQIEGPPHRIVVLGSEQSFDVAFE